MELKLEELEYQRLAIQSVVKIFEGNEKNTLDNACIEGIRFNMWSLSAAQIQKERRNTASAVSYTHLDVYKRQVLDDTEGVIYFSCHYTHRGCGFENAISL